MVKKTRELDFTLEKYGELCETILASGYQAVTLKEYFLNIGLSDRFAILRHDIDRKPHNALKIATVEKDLGIRASYYFRATKEVFRPEIMQAIAAMGHEIGYHYETLSYTKGDYPRAIKLFGDNLGRFRAIADIQTVCMHGAPLSPYDNRDMWKRYDLKSFGLLGEAYLSAGNDLCYFSDTGRTWDMGRKIRDILPSGVAGKADTTDSLKRFIASGKAPRLYVLTHPERWSDNGFEWAANYAKDALFNEGKRAISMVR